MNSKVTFAFLRRVFTRFFGRSVIVVSGELRSGVAEGVSTVNARVAGLGSALAVGGASALRSMARTWKVYLEEEIEAAFARLDASLDAAR